MQDIVVKNCALSRFRYKDIEGLRGRESTDNGQKRGSRWISKAFGTNILQSCISFSGFISSGKRTRRSEYSPARCLSRHRGRFWECAGRTVTKIRARGGKTRNGDPPPRPTTNPAGKPCTDKKGADPYGSSESVRTENHKTPGNRGFISLADYSVSGTSMTRNSESDSASNFNAGVETNPAPSRRSSLVPLAVTEPSITKT